MPPHRDPTPKDTMFFVKKTLDLLTQEKDVSKQLQILGFAAAILLVGNTSEPIDQFYLWSRAVGEEIERVKKQADLSRKPQQESIIVRPNTMIINGRKSN